MSSYTPKAVASWPPHIPELILLLYAAGVPVHSLPLFGRWLFDDLSEASELTAAPSTAKFARLSQGQAEQRVQLTVGHRHTLWDVCGVYAPFSDTAGAALPAQQEN